MPIQMTRCTITMAWTLAISFFIALPTCAQQTTAPSNQDLDSKLPRELNLQRSSISEQRVQRQTEVLRLEKIIDDLRSRITRLERQQISNSRLPAITVAEAEAKLAYTEAQLAENLDEEDGSNASAPARRAHDRLRVIQARGQLVMAKAASREALLMLELDVLHYERRFATVSQEVRQLERLAARGLATNEGLKLKLLDLKSAEKELQLSRLRLETQQTLAVPVNPDKKPVNADKKSASFEKAGE